MQRNQHLEQQFHARNFGLQNRPAYNRQLNKHHIIKQPLATNLKETEPNTECEQMTAKKAVPRNSNCPLHMCLDMEIWGSD